MWPYSRERACSPVDTPNKHLQIRNDQCIDFARALANRIETVAHELGAEEATMLAPAAPARDTRGIGRRRSGTAAWSCQRPSRWP